MSTSERVLPYVCAGLFIAIGLAVAIFLGIVPIVQTSLKYVKTTATVCNVETYWTTDDEGYPVQMAQMTYEYYFDGVRYEKKASYGQSPEFSKFEGETLTIYVNPDDPTDVADRSWIEGFVTGLGLFIALVGAGVAVGVAVYRKKHGVADLRV